MLIKDKGAPTGQPIDAYGEYVRAYNGAGPIADAYAARVLADAHAYQGAGTIAVAAGCSAAFGTPLVPGTRARILADGDAAAPADAPAAVQEMIAAGNRINHFAYSYGGAHGDPAQTMNQTNPNPAAVPGAEENGGPGYDCSSATSYVLWGGGLGQSLLGGGVGDSSELESVGDPGPGKVGDDLRDRRPRLHRGRGHLPRHRGGTRQPAQPSTHGPALEPRRHRARRVRRAASARAVTGTALYAFRGASPTITSTADGPRAEVCERIQTCAAAPTRPGLVIPSRFVAVGIPRPRTKLASPFVAKDSSARASASRRMRWCEPADSETRSPPQAGLAQRRAESPICIGKAPG